MFAHIFLFQSMTAFQATVNDEGLIVATLDSSDLQENVTAYAVQISGEPRTILIQFVNTSESLLYNASFHGLCYTVGLLLRRGQAWSRPMKTVAVLTSKNLSNHGVGGSKSLILILQDRTMFSCWPLQEINLRVTAFHF